MVNGRIRLSSPTMHDEEMQYIQEAFDKNWVAPLGFNCDGFEAEMVEYLKTAGTGCKYDLRSLCLVSALPHSTSQLSSLALSPAIPSSVQT